ncbi:MAG: lamin tail domain-containing protein [Phycisphaerales bacterium]|nr:MAG: lamin tail domain-containing protein [Phycisphaerales bacterium]
MFALTAALVVLLVAPVLYALYPSTAAFPAALEDPVVDGAFTTPMEYAAANRVLDDLGVGHFYRQHRENWTVNGITYTDTVTFFDLHFFFHSAYGQLDLYDMNSWDLQWGDTRIQVWVFLAGDHPDPDDWTWLDPSEIGSGTYPAGYNDDGGFLVRLNGDPSTDRIWNVGDPQPGDPSWDFADYYGVFIQGGFNNSAFTQGYSGVTGNREIYEFSLTMNQIPGTGPTGDDGGIPGVPQFSGPDEDNPIPPGICDPIWEAVWDWEKVKDWKPEMGGFGTFGGTGYIPVIVDWVIMGWDDSMHQGEVPPDEDSFATPGDGGTFVIFGPTPALPPLPADFFGPGSDPFEGHVTFEGDPFDPDSLGDTSTQVQRAGHPVFPPDPPGAMGTVEIEIVELSLVSVAPIIVTYFGGGAPEQWDVAVSLSEVPGPVGGSLTALKTHPNGGTYDAHYYVQLAFTFTRVSDGTERNLDTGAVGLPPHYFEIVGAPFVHSLAPFLNWIIAPSDGIFVPGVDEPVPGDPLSQTPVATVAWDPAVAASHILVPAERPLLTINELEYDQPGFDDREFIELFNPGTTPMSMDGWSLEFFNGADAGNLYRTVDLSVTPPLGARDYLVVGTPLVPNVDIPEWTDNGIQNGGTSPDGIALLWNGVVVEALSYEGSGTNGFVAQGGNAGGTFLPLLYLEDATSNSLQKIPDGGTWTETPNQTPGEANFLGLAPVGACCLEDGTCAADVAEYACVDMNGVWRGEGSMCLDLDAFVACLAGPVDPIPTGCIAWDQDDSGHIDLGDFALIQQHICIEAPDPTGACCTPYDVCDELTLSECNSNGGGFRGEGTVCSPNPCECVSIDALPDIPPYPDDYPIPGVCVTGAIVNNDYDLVNSPDVKNFHIQDPVGVAGLTVFGDNAEINSLLAIGSAGDEIKIWGTLELYFDTPELVGPFEMTYLSSPGVPSPLPLFIADLMAGYPTNKGYLSTLIILQNVEFDPIVWGTPFAYGNYTVHDVANPADTLTCRIANSEPGVLPIIGTPVPAGPVNIIGICAMYSHSYQVQPRVPGDIL